MIDFFPSLSLYTASAYTEINAISKGVSLGIEEKDKGKNLEASRVGTQPYIDLMGRRSVNYIRVIARSHI